MLDKREEPISKEYFSIDILIEFSRAKENRNKKFYSNLKIVWNDLTSFEFQCNIYSEISMNGYFYTGSFLYIPAI